MSRVEQPRHPLEGDPSVRGNNPTTASRIRLTRRSSTIRSSPAEELTSVLPRLTDRDRAILDLLDQHRVLTTGHLAAIFFDSVVTCQHRLAVLCRLGLLDRIVRYRPSFGRHPHCFVLGPAGLRYAALVRGERPPTPRTVREHRDRLAVSPTLAHLLAVNQFHTELLAYARARPDAALRRWWSEQATAEAYGRRIQPDGHGIWTEDESTVGYFLECDLATEPLRRLAAKVAAYERLHHDGGPAFPVLFWLPSRGRETNLHARLRPTQPTVPVATATHDSIAAGGPAGSVWRLLGNGRSRLRLAELPNDPGQPGPLNPGLDDDGL